MVISFVSLLDPFNNFDFLGVESPVDCYVKVLHVHLHSKSALQRLMAGLVIAEWAKLDKETTSCPDALKFRLHQCLCEYVYFDEIAVSFTRLVQDTKDFIAMMKHYKVVERHKGPPRLYNCTCRLAGPDHSGKRLRPNVGSYTAVDGQ